MNKQIITIVVRNGNLQNNTNEKRTSLRIIHHKLIINAMEFSDNAGHYAYAIINRGIGIFLKTFAIHCCFGAFTWNT